MAMANPKIALQIDWPVGRHALNLRVVCYHGEFSVAEGYLRADLCPSDESGRDLEMVKSIILPPQDAAEVFASMGELLIAKIKAMGPAELNRQVPGLGDAMASAKVVE